MKKIGVLFVCLGNICRSPSAQGIFQHQVDNAGLNQRFIIDSCGTAPFNIGKKPDNRAIHATQHFGYNIEGQIARQINHQDFQTFSYIITMDRKNLMNLSGWTPADYTGEIGLFMHFHPNNLGNSQIPDPYHEGADAFLPIIKTIEQASAGLLTHIRNTHNF